MFTLNSSDTTPLYRQLFQQIREKILTGTLPAHFKLPSILGLAEELTTSRNTVESAFQELRAEGYIYSKPRSGYFISDIDKQFAVTSQIVQRKQDLHPKLAESYPYDFHPARLDPVIFPTALWRKCLLDALRAKVEDFSHYNDPQGEWGLRCNIQFYLEHSRGVLCSPDQIVICSGLQQGLHIVAQLLKDSHKEVVFENPGYCLPKELFQSHGFTIIHIDVGLKGLAIHELNALSDAAVYVTPSHQMPLGHVMPVADRMKLISWAKSRNGVIIEDDYDSELRYIGKPIPSLQGLSPDSNIIYQGTFSKVFSPALRLSYMVLPRSFSGNYQRIFRNHLSQVSLLSQRAMTIFMERGHWEQHIRRARIFYKKKHGITLQAIGQYFGDKAKIIGQGAGLHIVLELAKSLEDEAVFIDQAQQCGCRLLPFSDFSISGEPKNNKLILGFGGITIEDIPRGIEKLSGMIKSC
jgi:GntR family transcriptional regulator/MocR family aminotransferase